MKGNVKSGLRCFYLRQDVVHFLNEKTSKYFLNGGPKDLKNRQKNRCMF